MAVYSTRGVLSIIDLRISCRNIRRHVPGYGSPLDSHFETSSTVLSGLTLLQFHPMSSSEHYSRTFSAGTARTSQSAHHIWF